MAEEIDNNVVTDNPQTPTIEELTAQLASAKADADRYKAANDKLSKESADYKRQLRAKQTEEEVEAEKRAEAQRIRDEEYEAVKAENSRMKAMNAYKAISEEKTVEALISAVSDADHNAIAKIIAQQCEKAVAEAEATWLKNRPSVQNGQHSSMTKEEIMNIKDPVERQRKIAENMKLFKKER